MYILPKDIHKDTVDIIPYGFEVDIIKDCSSLQKDIADVFNVIDRNSQNYVQTIDKVCFLANMHLILISNEYIFSNFFSQSVFYISSLSKPEQSCSDIMTMI